MFIYTQSINAQSYPLAPYNYSIFIFLNLNLYRNNKCLLKVPSALGKLFFIDRGYSLI